MGEIYSKNCLRWCGANLRHELASSFHADPALPGVACLDDDDQEIAAIQEFIDCPLPRRMAGLQDERPGSDSAF
jgi:hypothetical protein